MKLAAIDIGSNSLHMIVARIDGDGNFDIIARQKEMVRLGERSLAEGYLSDEAQQRGMDTLRDFAQTARGYGVTDIIACATSAVRESRNGQEFIERVCEETGIDARIIEGVEEGRLIYLGVREVWDFGARNALIIDIGGGSVEFILADRRREYVVRSLKLGVRRLRDEYLPSDPPTPAEVAALEAHIREAVAPVVAEVKRRGFQVVLGSSGTARALARIAAGDRGGDLRFTQRADLSAAVDTLAARPLADRGAVSGVDEKRRDAILEGGVLMRTLLSAFGAEEYEYCDAALREGMIVDYLERNRPGLRMIGEVTDPRRRSVLTLAKRLLPNLAHAEQVARLAVRLFDDLSALHGCDPRTRDLFEFAAILHDVGRVIRRSAHHKHTLYILRNAELAGFSDAEQLLVANLARYHRRSEPKERHEAFMALDDDYQHVVRVLSPLMRVANTLDRGRQSNIYALTCTDDGETVTLRYAAHGPADLEVRATERRSHHFPRVYGRELVIVADPNARPLTETPDSQERV